MTNMLGVYELSLRKITFETGLTVEAVTKAFEAFERDRKAFYIDGFVILINWLKNQSMNTNMKTSALRIFDNLPNWLKERLQIKASEGFESLSKGFEMLSKKEKEKEIESEIEDESESKADYDLIVDFYHKHCPNLSRVQSINDTRKGYMNARFAEYGIEKIEEVFRIAGGSNFLNGNNEKRWKADFEWLIRPENFLKTLEGKYNNKDTERRLSV
ncbi:MAG: hypothetical protein GX885_11505 [Methanomicrobiales archaeon]|nr:hypothetical protein [Methanomicrobiales archaeon]